MKFLYDFFPILLFFVSYKMYDIYVATGVMLVMLPDTGERYLSTILFEGIHDGSDDEWLAGLS